ncbi:uncharacterized protein LOC115743642 isoform X2 [Rhodamnia argentea]|uniref:Uncharacterized protein LOC115743642 isoform X2 n=1 Tax=Rhodamnia argentea TaxID=178133 RepID=A0A8B8PHT5_9MYRT|nr:uncharacterized protein LOC115743642 isoform X2 [Rhodamnia argentea]
MPGRPRQTERNARITRMDAALHAMRPYGFPERMVRETVRELLGVYDDKWDFIEDDAYNTLLEFILEKQNECVTKEVEASASSRKDGETSTMLMAGPSSGVVLSEHEAEAATNDIEAAESSSKVDEALPLASALPTLEIDCPPEVEGHRRGHKDVGHDEDSGGGRQAPALIIKRESSGAKDILQSFSTMLDCPPGFEGYRRGCKDVRDDHDSSGGRQAPALTSKRESSGAEDILQSALRLLPTNGSAPQVVANGAHLRRRRRYHGWIGCEEEEEMVQLPPALLPEFLTNNRMDKQSPEGQRKRRWDARP